MAGDACAWGSDILLVSLLWLPVPPGFFQIRCFLANEFHNVCPFSPEDGVFLPPPRLLRNYYVRLAKQFHSCVISSSLGSSRRENSAQKDSEAGGGWIKNVCHKHWKGAGSASLLKLGLS